ncbi:hypothetical protein Dimus_037521 [Dionaea muscipula]
MRKKSRKKLGKWICPGVVSGLSAEYVFSDEDDHEEGGSLHTIDEDDDEGELEDTSNPSEDDLGDDLEQCSHPVENASCDFAHASHAVVDGGRSHDQKVIPLHDDGGMCSILEQAIEIFPEVARFVKFSLNFTKIKESTGAESHAQSYEYSRTHGMNRENSMAGTSQDDHRDTGQPAQACNDDHLDINQMISQEIPLENAACCPDYEEHHIFGG